MAARFPELEDANWLRQRYLVEGLSSFAIAAELGCRATTVSRALQRHGIAARVGRPAAVRPGEV
jgi:IS30 family transposase